jgi:hypothetical protein
MVAAGIFVFVFETQLAESCAWGVVFVFVVVCCIDCLVDCLIGWLRLIG